MQQGQPDEASREISFDEFAPASYAEWKDAAIAALKGADFDKKMFTKLVDGITLNPIYNSSDVTHPIEKPGEFPYRRGTRSLGYRERPWYIAQSVSACTAKGLNGKLLEELEGGCTGLSILLDCPQGVKLETLEDWKKAFENVVLEALPVWITPGSCGLGALAMYVETARAQGADLRKLTGGVTYDPIAHLASRGSFCSGMGFCGARKQLVAMVKWTLEHTSAPFAAVGVSGLPFHNAGASAMQEVACMLSAAVTYLRALEAGGICVEDAAPRLRFTTGVGNNLFLEVAKIRALRMLWAQVVRACGGSDEAAKINLHARTSSWTISRVDPWVNMLRATAQAFSAVLGGVDSLDVVPFDSAVRRPDGFSRRIARNVQLILQGECNMDKVADPAGGSYYIENLTDAVAQSAWDLFRKLEAEGGIVASLKAGTIQKAVAALAGKRYEYADQRRQTIVGVNKYVNLDEKPLEKPNCPSSSRRDESACLEQKPVALAGTAMEDVLAVVPTAAMGSVQKALAGLYACPVGVSVEPLVPCRISERFERLLDRAAAFRAKTGSCPQIFLANMGPLRQFKARADFSQDFLKAGGFDVVYPAGFKTVQEAADAAVASGLGACVICSTDDTYDGIVPEFCRRVKAAKPEMIILLAGYPADLVSSFKSAGVDMFIHVKANCHDVLESLQTRLGL